MCRNIRTLFNFEPPVTDEEIDAAFRQVKALGVTTVSAPLTMAAEIEDDWGRRAKKIGKKEQDAILGTNAARLFGLDTKIGRAHV